MRTTNIELVRNLMDSLKRQLENKIEFQDSKSPKDDYEEGWKAGSLYQVKSILETINTYFYEE